MRSNPEFDTEADQGRDTKEASVITNIRAKSR
jgi:hypothetical protein